LTKNIGITSSFSKKKNKLHLLYKLSKKESPKIQKKIQFNSMQKKKKKKVKIAIYHEIFGGWLVIIFFQ